MTASQIVIGLLAIVVIVPPLIYFSVKMGVVGYYKGREFINRNK